MTMTIMLDFRLIMIWFSRLNCPSSAPSPQRGIFQSILCKNKAINNLIVYQVWLAQRERVRFLNCFLNRTAFDSAHARMFLHRTRSSLNLSFIMKPLPLMHDFESSKYVAVSHATYQSRKLLSKRNLWPNWPHDVWQMSSINLLCNTTNNPSNL